MASFFLATSNVFKLSSFISSLFFISTMAALSVSSHQFQVGGERGWVEPSGNKSTVTYNDWASRNRFHIGDAIYFKYGRDSVLVVNSADYQNCITTNPISKFEDGNTVYQFDRSGFFYFISGQPGHCKSGQKLIIRVMHPSEIEPPESAPSPNKGGADGWDSDDWGPPGLNSTTKLAVASYFLTALGGVFVILYLFM